MTKEYGNYRSGDSPARRHHHRGVVLYRSVGGSDGNHSRYCRSGLFYHQLAWLVPRLPAVRSLDTEKIGTVNTTVISVYVRSVNVKRICRAISITVATPH
jgi:hypothetical protein